MRQQLLQAYLDGVKRRRRRRHIEEPDDGGADPAELGEKLLAWWDTTDLTTLFQDAAGTVPVTKHGDPVGLLVDKSGNGVNLSQSTDAARPLWQSDGSLLFDGTDDHLTGATTGLPVGGNPCEIFVIVSQDADPSDNASRMLLGYGGTSANNSRRILRFIESSASRTRVAVGSGAASTLVAIADYDFSGTPAYARP